MAVFRRQKIGIPCRLYLTPLQLSVKRKRRNTTVYPLALAFSHGRGSQDRVIILRRGFGARLLPEYGQRTAFQVI